MANWQVFADKIKLFDHPNAERLALGKLGSFQIVVGKDNEYKDGDLVIFSPQRSLLPDEIKNEYCNADTGISYLSGPEKNRVKSVRLRGQLSEGVTLNREWVLKKNPAWKTVDDIPLNEDLSEILGIKEWIPPIPTQLSGQVENLKDFNSHWETHDVEQYHIFKNEFIEGEDVVVTEKIHGSQVHYILHNNELNATSKGIGRRPQVICPSEGNMYWQAARNENIEELLKETKGTIVHAFGEVFPCQGGNFTYGQTKPTVRLYRLIINDKEYSTSLVRTLFPNIFKLWVPVLYEGPLDEAKILELSKGMETVSGKQHNIKEGVVVSPHIPRNSTEGFKLFLKVINPKYKDSEEDIS